MLTTTGRSPSRPVAWPARRRAWPVPGAAGGRDRQPGRRGGLVPRSRSQPAAASAAGLVAVLVLARSHERGPYLDRPAPSRSAPSLRKPGPSRSRRGRWTAVEVGDDTTALAARQQLAALQEVIDDPFMDAVSQLAIAWATPITGDFYSSSRAASVAPRSSQDEPLWTALAAWLTCRPMQTSAGLSRRRPQQPARGSRPGRQA